MYEVMLEKNYNEVFAVDKRTQTDTELDDDDEREQLAVLRKQAKRKDLMLRLVLRTPSSELKKSNKPLLNTSKSRALRSSVRLRKSREMTEQEI